MSKTDKNAIYGSTLNKTDLEPFIKRDEKIPFVYIYSCIGTIPHSLEEIESQVKKEKNTLPDFKSVQILENYINGNLVEEVLIMFTKNQRSLQLVKQEDTYLVQMSFRNHGKEWGSNYAIWLLTQKWMKDYLSFVFLKDEMSHVNPTDIRLPKL